MNNANYLSIGPVPPKVSRTVNYIYFRPDFVGAAFTSQANDNSYPWTGPDIMRRVSGQLNVPECSFTQLVTGARHKLPENLKICHMLRATSALPSNASDSARGVEYITLEDDSDVLNWVIAASNKIDVKFQEYINCLVVTHRPPKSDGGLSDPPPPFLMEKWLNL